MEKIKILYLEDNPADAQITSRFIENELPFSEIILSEDKESYLSALDTFQPDLVLSDHSLAQFNSVEALEICTTKISGGAFYYNNGCHIRRICIRNHEIGCR